MNWKFWRKPQPQLIPNLEEFHSAIVHSVYGRDYTAEDVAADFRRTMDEEPARGRRVMFSLLTWCGEYMGPPEDNDALQRWAGKQEVAALIKAAMHADLSPEEVKEPDYYGRRE